MKKKYEKPLSMISKFSVSPYIADYQYYGNDKKCAGGEFPYWNAGGTNNSLLCGGGPVTN